ncbi:MAG: glycosyltransferase [Roseiflexaceae bacterium]|nr:glycosyltransferase [Roseiflexaceae bacterium]
MARGTGEARRLLRELRPAAILGTGGYVCVPLFLAARAQGVPTAIYLPDVVPGLAVQWLAKIATVVTCNVEDSAKYFGLQADVRLEGSRNLQSKLVVTGYPVRAELFTQDKAACRAAFGLAGALPTLLVYGGSRGARSINQAIAALLPHLLPLAQIIHVCGREGDEQFLQDAATQLPMELRERYKLYPYLFSGDQRPGIRGQGPGVRDQGLEARHQEPGLPLEGEPDSPALQRRELVRREPKTMTAAFGAADLAICRSGASTLAELPAAGLPAVLIPYPFVHQEENADYLVARGAALKLQDGAMLGTGRPEHGPLFGEVRRLLLAHDERFRMSERSRSLARPDAAHRLAEVLLALATSTRNE